MRYIRILSVGGLFHEFYNPLPTGLSITALNLSENELDATNLFWTYIFDTENIKRIIDRIVPSSPKYIAIVSDTDTFIKQIEIAKDSICKPDITVKDFFAIWKYSVLFAKFIQSMFLIPIGSQFKMVLKQIITLLPKYIMIV